MKNKIKTVKGNIVWADKEKTKAVFKPNKKGKYSLLKSTQS